MDSLTHTITGAVIAEAIRDERLGKWGTYAGLAMGIFPDSDFVLGLFDRQFYLEYHRDFTHSLLLIPFYALFFSWLFVRISRRDHFWSFYKICLPVLASHVLLDLFTSYGTMVFSPFFNHRYAWDLVFIVDLIFSGIIIIPWLAGFFWRKRAQWLCRGSLLALALYVCFCFVQHERAVDLARGFANGLNEKTVEVAALPQPASPFRWGNYVETETRVYQGFVDLLMREAPPAASGEAKADPDGSSIFRKLRNLYRPPEKINYLNWEKLEQSPWVEKALATDGVKFYFWFARFPVGRSVNSNNGRHRVEFMDVRFLVPVIRVPFIYYVEFDSSGRIASEGFVDNRKR